MCDTFGPERKTDIPALRSSAGGIPASASWPCSPPWVGTPGRAGSRCPSWRTAPSRPGRRFRSGRHRPGRRRLQRRRHSEGSWELWGAGGFGIQVPFLPLRPEGSTLTAPSAHGLKKTVESVYTQLMCLRAWTLQDIPTTSTESTLSTKSLFPKYRVICGAKRQTVTRLPRLFLEMLLLLPLNDYVKTGNSQVHCGWSS